MPWDMGQGDVRQGDGSVVPDVGQGDGSVVPLGQGDGSVVPLSPVLYRAKKRMSFRAEGVGISGTILRLRRRLINIVSIGGDRRTVPASHAIQRSYQTQPRQEKLLVLQTDN